MKILLVEDDAALARATSRALQEHGFVVIHAGRVKDADFSARTEMPAAIVLDLGLPDGDGVQLLESWRRDHIDIPVLVLTARSRWADKAEGFTAGADDYLTKPFSTAELVFRLRALVRRASGHAHPKLTRGDIVLDTLTGVVTRDGLPVALTAQELRVFSYLMHKAPQVVSRSELTEQVYDGDREPDSNVIDVQIGRLRRKLGDACIETERGRGYRIMDTTDEI